MIADPERVTPVVLQEWKRHGRRIAMTTAYDAFGARFADDAGIDVILVGDTAGEVVMGHSSTVPVTLDEQVKLTRAVSAVARRALVVGDLPFGAYEVSDGQAVENAMRLINDGGAHVVKLEGPRAARVRAIAEAGIGIMGHLGLTPQTETALGGRRVQGRTAAHALELLRGAKALRDAGCFALVLEAVPGPVAARITEELDIPTIGIGAGAGCDGQVLVSHDLLGLAEGAPRFTKRYVDLGALIGDALARAVGDVHGEARDG